MKKVIAKILREQWDEEETPIPEKMLQRYFKFIDRVGIKIALPLLGLEDDEKKAEVLVKYYRESNNPKEEYIPRYFPLLLTWILACHLFKRAKNETPHTPEVLSLLFLAFLAFLL